MIVARDPGIAEWPSTHRMIVEWEEQGIPMVLACRFLEMRFVRFRRHLDFDHPDPPFSRLFVFEEKGAVITTALERFRCEPGRLYLLPSHCRFHALYDPGAALLYFHLHIAHVTGRSLFAGHPEVCQIEDASLWSAVLNRFHGGDSMTLYAEILRLLRRVLAPRWQDFLQEGDRLRKFRRFFELTQRTPIARITVTDAARLYGMTENAFSKRFIRSMGISIKEFLLQEQIRRAQSLLVRTEMTVGQIAAHLGHENATYFHRLFHKRCGMTPIEFRRKQRTCSA